MERIVVQQHFPKASIPKLKRVAAYARVSCGKDAMLHSLSAQVSYYSDLIQNHSGWQYVGVYADEALTGTRDNRENFQRLLADCRAGKVDLVLTKSISRFARNTVTLLETVRELKTLGVYIYFEEQNIHSLSADGELMLTILASYAQKESLSVSENQKWRVRHNFENGMPWNGTVLGYRYDHGTFMIEPAEAEIVRFIFDSYSTEIGATTIAKMLNQKKVPTRYGNEWHDTSVMGILRNYSYTGNLLLQKSFTVDFLQKKMKVIEGEVPQYYVEHSHEAIIAPEEWERVQLELVRRKNSPRRTHCNSPFAGKLICGDCGEIFGSKVWHSTSKYRRTIWQCNAKFKGEEKCRTPHLYEDDLKQHFITALSKLLTDRDVLLDNLRTVRAQWLDFHAIEKECENLLQEMDVVFGMIKAVVNENASMEMSQAAYTNRYNALVDRFEKSQSRYDELQNLKERRQIQADEISGCLFTLHELDSLELKFNDSLWHTVIRHVVVYNDEHLIFHFKTGHEISVKI